jgi:hypothetical protein
VSLTKYEGEGEKGMGDLSRFKGREKVIDEKRIRRRREIIETGKLEEMKGDQNSCLINWLFQ